MRALRFGVEVDTQQPALPCTGCCQGGCPRGSCSSPARPAPFLVCIEAANPASLSQHLQSCPAEPRLPPAPYDGHRIPESLAEQFRGNPAKIAFLSPRGTWRYCRWHIQFLQDPTKPNSPLSARGIYETFPCLGEPGTRLTQEEGPVDINYL